MRKSKFDFFLILLSILFVNPLFSQKKAPKYFDLEYQLKKDTVFLLKNRSVYADYKNEKDKLIKWNFMNAHMELVYNVLSSSEEDGLTLEVEYADRYRKLEFRGTVTEPDFSNLIGGKIQYKLSPKGDISGFKNFEELNVSLGEDGEESIQNLQEEIIHLLPHLPENPVQIGDKWTGRVEAGNSGGENFKIEYTLVEELVQDGLDCVKIIARYTTNSKNSVTQRDKTYIVNRDGQGHDVYLFAYKKGFLLSRTSIGDETMDIFDSANNPLQQRIIEVIYETDIVFR